MNCENVRCPDPRLLREVGDLILIELKTWTLEPETSPSELKA
jgi:hypothetical protein